MLKQWLEQLVTPIETFDYGDVMGMDVWLECVSAGSFTDYDGFGYLTDGDDVLTLPIYPSNSTNIAYWNIFKAPKIIWFNR